MQVEYSLLEGFVHGRGRVQVTDTPDPAVGVEFSYKVTGTYWERLRSLSFQLVTSAAVASRQVTLLILDQDGVELAAIPAATAQIASLTRKYTFLPDVSQQSGPVSGRFLGTLPTFFLRSDWTVKVEVALIDAGDQVSHVRLNRERFDTSDTGYPIGIVEVDGKREIAAVQRASLEA